MGRGRRFRLALRIVSEFVKEAFLHPREISIIDPETGKTVRRIRPEEIEARR